MPPESRQTERYIAVIVKVKKRNDKKGGGMCRWIYSIAEETKRDSRAERESVK